MFHATALSPQTGPTMRELAGRRQCARATGNVFVFVYVRFGAGRLKARTTG